MTELVFCLQCEIAVGVDDKEREQKEARRWACSVCRPNGPFTMTYAEADECEMRHTAEDAVVASAASDAQTAAAASAATSASASVDDAASMDVDEAVNEGEGETAASLLAGAAAPQEQAESWGLGDLWEDAAAPDTPFVGAEPNAGRRRSSVAGWESEPSVFGDMTGLDFDLGGGGAAAASTYTSSTLSTGQPAL
jgi:hypothetical protein